MRLCVPFYGHYPEKEDKTRDGEDAGSLEEVVGFASLPAEVKGKTETYRIEDQQLIRKVFQQILHSETRVATQQVVLEAGEMVVDLP